MKFRIGKFNFAFWTDKVENNRSKGGRPKTIVNFEEIKQLHDAGNSVREIAEKVHISKSTVSNILRNPQKYKKK